MAVGTVKYSVAARLLGRKSRELEQAAGLGAIVGAGRWQLATLYFNVNYCTAATDGATD